MRLRLTPSALVRRVRRETLAGGGDQLDEAVARLGREPDEIVELPDPVSSASNGANPAKWALTLGAELVVHRRHRCEREQHRDVRRETPRDRGGVEPAAEVRHQPVPAGTGMSRPVRRSCGRISGIVSGTRS